MADHEPFQKTRGPTAKTEIFELQHIGKEKLQSGNLSEIYEMSRDALNALKKDIAESLQPGDNYQIIERKRTQEDLRTKVILRDSQGVGTQTRLGNGTGLTLEDNFDLQIFEDDKGQPRLYIKIKVTNTGEKGYVAIEHVGKLGTVENRKQDFNELVAGETVPSRKKTTTTIGAVSSSPEASDENLPEPSTIEVSEDGKKIQVPYGDGKSIIWSIDNNTLAVQDGHMIENDGALEEIFRKMLQDIRNLKIAKANFDKITYLNLAGQTNLTIGCLDHIITYFPNIETINLSGIANIGTQEIKDFMERQSSRLPKLKDITVGKDEKIAKESVPAPKPNSDPAPTPDPAPVKAPKPDPNPAPKPDPNPENKDKKNDKQKPDGKGIESKPYIPMTQEEKAKVMEVIKTRDPLDPMKSENMIYVITDKDNQTGQLYQWHKIKFYDKGGFDNDHYRMMYYGKNMINGGGNMWRQRTSIKEDDTLCLLPGKLQDQEWYVLSSDGINDFTKPLVGAPGMILDGNTVAIPLKLIQEKLRPVQTVTNTPPTSVPIPGQNTAPNTLDQNNPEAVKITLLQLLTTTSGITKIKPFEHPTVEMGGKKTESKDYYGEYSIDDVKYGIRILETVGTSGGIIISKINPPGTTDNYYVVNKEGKIEKRDITYQLSPKDAQQAIITLSKKPQATVPSPAPANSTPTVPTPAPGPAPAPTPAPEPSPVVTPNTKEELVTVKNGEVDIDPLIVELNKTSVNKEDILEKYITALINTKDADGNTGLHKFADDWDGWNTKLLEKYFDQLVATTNNDQQADSHYAISSLIWHGKDIWTPELVTKILLANIIRSDWTPAPGENFLAQEIELKKLPLGTMLYLKIDNTYTTIDKIKTIYGSQIDMRNIMDFKYIDGEILKIVETPTETFDKLTSKVGTKGYTGLVNMFKYFLGLPGKDEKLIAKQREGYIKILDFVLKSKEGLTADKGPLKDITFTQNNENHSHNTTLQIGFDTLNVNEEGFSIAFVENTVKITGKVGGKDRTYTFK